VACNRSDHEHQSAAVGRVLRVQASSFQGRRVMTALKRGCVQKNSFHFSSKKRGARVACNRSDHEHQSAAVGRVLRVQASSFQERRVMTALKRGCVQKNSFHFSSKKRGARVACNRSGHEHQSAAVGRVLRVQASSFQERRVMTALKRGCVQKNSFHFSSEEKGLGFQVFSFSG